MKDVGVEKADPLASQTNNKEQLKSVKSDLDAKQKQAQELTAQLTQVNNEIGQLEAQQDKLEGKAVSLEERAMNEETENILNKAKQTAKQTQTEKSNIELTQQTEQQKLDVKEKSIKRLEEKAKAVEAAEETENILN